MSLTLIQKIPMVINKEIYSYIETPLRDWKNKIMVVNEQFHWSWDYIIYKEMRRLELADCGIPLLELRRQMQLQMLQDNLNII
jgi:hypothetical protein